MSTALFPVAAGGKAHAGAARVSGRLDVARTGRLLLVLGIPRSVTRSRRLLLTIAPAGTRHRTPRARLARPVHRGATRLRVTLPSAFSRYASSCRSAPLVVVGTIAPTGRRGRSPVLRFRLRPRCAPAPAPVPAPSRALRWAPPTLSNPVVVTASAATRELRLDPARDYEVRLPAAPLAGPGGLVISGGHNVVLRGGDILIQGVAHPDEVSARCVGIFNATGVVHIEGLWCHGSDLFEGIQNYAAQATVQIENTRIDHIHAHDEVSFSDGHPDLVQFGAGRELRVDGLTGSSDYQGIFLTGPIAGARLQRVDITGAPSASQLLWRNTTNIGLELTNVFIRPPAGRTIGTAVWPSIYNADPGLRPWEASPGRWRWPNGANIAGWVDAGGPPTEFVPAGTAGTGYVSPGYAPG
ncbi:MAG TPA: hypothetical protein VGN78_13135 [Solirubrobacteraceae bacterium]|nr:hypothetical protein [Solirubrobacteraceae bacterium]